MENAHNHWQGQAASVLRVYSSVLERLAHESHIIQKTLGDMLEERFTPGSIQRLQSLDMHMQLQQDLARVAVRLSDNIEAGRFDVDELRAVCRLQSTVSLLFNDETELCRETGDVHLF